MKINYKKLWVMLIERDIKKADLRKMTGISSATMARLGKNEPVSLPILLSICAALKCDVGDICTAIPDDENETEV